MPSNVHMHTRINVSIALLVCICMYVYIYVCMYICMYAELEIGGVASQNANHYNWGNCESL